MEYGTLPQNYPSPRPGVRSAGRAARLEACMPGASIGGDIFGNYEGSLPEKEGRTYTECDINTAGADERAERVLYFQTMG